MDWERAIKRVDPSKAPDGSCWTVVQRRGDETISRTRFGDYRRARDFALTVVGQPGILVHLEGPQH